MGFAPKGDTMRSLFSIIVLGFALVATSARAAVTVSESLSSACAGGCVDTWQVDCSSGKTGRIEARVRDLIDGSVTFFAVTTMGFTGSKLLGKSDREVVSVPESTFSIPAFLSQPPNADGSMRGLVMISLTQSLSAASGKAYVVEFLCRDAFGALEVGEPNVKLLKDL